MFGRHVDDGAGVASSQRVIDHLQHVLSAGWNIKLSRWKKVLGFDITIKDESNRSTVVVSGLAAMQRMFAAHAEGEMVVKPRHPYPSNINEVTYAPLPAEDSPEYATTLALHEQHRSGLGFSVWVMRAHVQLH